MIRVLVCPEPPPYRPDCDPFDITPFRDVVDDGSEEGLTTATHCIWCGYPLDEHEELDGTPGCWDPRTMRTHDAADA